jgi:hypothetical protein
MVGNLIKMMTGAFLFALLLTGPPDRANAAGAPDGAARRIIAEMITAYGGKEAISRITSVAARGTITDYLKGVEGGYARFFQRPGRLRIEIMPANGGEIRILDHGRGWQRLGGEYREVRPATLQSMIYQYSYLDLPMGLADDRYPVSYGGSRDLDGRVADLLLIEPAGAPLLRVLVDRETHLIARVAANFDMGMGASELVTRYEDFRPVAGVLFPFRLINHAAALRLSTIAIASLEVNGTMGPELFSPTATGAR